MSKAPAPSNPSVANAPKRQRKTEGAPSRSRGHGKMPGKVLITSVTLEFPTSKQIRKVPRDEADRLISEGTHRPVKRSYLRDITKPIYLTPASITRPRYEDILVKPLEEASKLLTAKSHIQVERSLYERLKVQYDLKQEQATKKEQRRLEREAKKRAREECQKQRGY